MRRHTTTVDRLNCATRINGPLEKLLRERGLRRAVVQTHCPLALLEAVDFFVQFAVEVQRDRDRRPQAATELPHEPELLHEASFLRACGRTLALDHTREKACELPHRELARERRAVVPSATQR